MDSLTLAMDPLIIAAVAVLLVTIVAAIFIFRPGKDFSEERAQATFAPSSPDGKVTMKYMGGETHDANGQPLQDVLETREDVNGPPMPNALKPQGAGVQGEAGLLTGRPKPPAPSPANGPVMRPFNPGAVMGGDGAAAPVPGEGQKDVLNFTQPPTQKPGPKREE